MSSRKLEYLSTHVIGKKGVATMNLIENNRILIVGGECDSNWSNDVLIFNFDYDFVQKNLFKSFNFFDLFIFLI
jgi:hypothetical protein